MFGIGFFVFVWAAFIAWAFTDSDANAAKKLRMQHPKIYYWCSMGMLIGLTLMLLSMAVFFWQVML